MYYQMFQDKILHEYWVYITGDVRWQSARLACERYWDRYPASPGVCSIVVSTSHCGCDIPGSNPGLRIFLPIPLHTNSFTSKKTRRYSSYHIPLHFSEKRYAAFSIPASTICVHFCLVYNGKLLFAADFLTNTIKKGTTTPNNAVSWYQRCGCVCRNLCTIGHRKLNIQFAAFSQSISIIALLNG